MVNSYLPLLKSSIFKKHFLSPHNIYVCVHYIQYFSKPFQLCVSSPFCCMIFKCIFLTRKDILLHNHSVVIEFKKLNHVYFNLLFLF